MNRTINETDSNSIGKFERKLITKVLYNKSRKRKTKHQNIDFTQRISVGYQYRTKI